MKTEVRQEEKSCTRCKIGKVTPDKVQFCVDRGDKIMLIGDVPAAVCTRCMHRDFEEAISDELTRKAHTIFAKSHGRMFAYQFSDLIRSAKDINTFEMFDEVRIKEGVNTWDLYDEHLLPGMKGVVGEKGENPFDYVVEFRIGKGRHDTLWIEMDEADLELVSRCGEKAPVTQKGAKPKAQETRQQKILGAS